jgi:hypothetical protein
LIELLDSILKDGIMSLGQLQTCNCDASGCAKRSFLVFFSYAFRAASKIDWKLEVAVTVEVDAIRRVIGLETIKTEWN